MLEIRLPSFAKINLVLKVLGKRRDGYHSLETIYQSVDLHDDLTFRFLPSDHFHLVLNVGDSDIPPDDSNLIYKALHLYHSIQPFNVRVEVDIVKRIPTQAGLGGGSSNAAVTLIAISRHLGWPLTRSKLLPLARRLGSDVPFFLYGGTALGSGRGEKIRKLPDWPAPNLLLVHSNVPCPTPAIYKAFDEADLLTHSRDSTNIHLDQRPESLRELVSLIENDLAQVVFALYPELDSIKKQIAETGAVTVSLTGSGSTLFALYNSAEDRNRAAGALPNSVSSRFIDRSEYQRTVFGNDGDMSNES
jgi:4-diphosphocytidyl-2-C-methyl-D-erythritol kinase